MKFRDKFVRSQLELAKPIVRGVGIDTSRSFQEKVGKFLQFVTRRSVVVSNEDFDGTPGAFAVPRDELRSGIIIYIHGGGYVSGGLEYAKGYASVLSEECGMRVAAFAYKLAPEAVFPAQIDECVKVYRHIMSIGYTPDRILLAGESAGGGLCFSLCRKLLDIGEALPAGILALSPWCDLTHSGESIERNKDKDPSLAKKTLEYYADCYVNKNDELKQNPFVSPVFADLKGFPPTLIFAGGDEILLSDAELMQRKLEESDVKSRLIVKPKMWHAYHLYHLKSSKSDYEIINSFIKAVFPESTQRKLRWMHLDNAAKIYPAARSSSWTNVFRVSVSLKENINREVLQSALDVTVRRFPSIAVRLRRGTFWYYLEEIAHAPVVMDERPYPLVRMPFDDIRSCAFRVIIYKNRIAVEFFHALTDGNGALIFLKTLAAEYISQRYGVKVSSTDGVLDRLEQPREEELVDLFPSHAGKLPATRRESDSYRIFGEREDDNFSTVTTFIMKSDELHKRARALGVSVTAFLTAAFIKAGIALQNIDVKQPKRQKPVKVLVPCDLRRIYGKTTLRNFVLYSTPGIDPRLGEYTFAEICDIVSKIMALEITPKNMAARIKTNVKDEENMLLKLTPLFLKNAVMKLVFLMCGEKKSMLTLSNLGVVKLPGEMVDYVERFDFVLSVQSKAPYNAGVISYGGTTCLNIIRNIKAARLEPELYRVLREEGISVKAESNQR
jgi:acetyl esterase/lipase